MYAWFLYSRCSASPGFYILGIFLGTIIQISAVTLPIVVSKKLPNEPFNRRLKYFYATCFLFVMSLMVLSYSIRYSDAIGKPNGFRSVGLQCFTPSS